MKTELFEKIIKKKELSQLPKKDIEMAFSHFEKRQVSDIEKIRLTRELLHKVFGAFGSKKLSGSGKKERSAEWFLKKHMSTRERLPFYKEVYRRLLKEDEITVFDLGAGVNGFSYKHFGKKLKYIAIEAVGQLVASMNSYFKKEKLNAKAFHLSLFETEKIKKIIKKPKGKKIVFIFKALDSLEMIERNYSKKLISEIAPLVEKIVVSFATESMVRRRKFSAKRKWIINFIEENFKVFDDFSFGGERYILFGRE